MLIQAGQVGFLLLLFEVGLEIDLPPFREFLRPLRYSFLWALAQYPIVFGLGLFAGLSWAQCLLASAALTACSVGMAHPAWKNLGDSESGAKTFTLHVMVALEMMAVVVLALETTAMGRGYHWIILAKLGGIVVTIFLIARFAAHLGNLFQLILYRTTHWRVHWLVLLVLVVCAAGARLGLDAAKTAFFLGLALSTTQHSGLSIEEQIAPISHRFLIPVFFVSLGMQIDWHLLVGWMALLAAGSATLLLGFREILHRRWLKTGGQNRTFLLFCPNLTIVALAAEALVKHGVAPELTAWLVLTGLFMTIASLLLLPSSKSEKPGNPSDKPLSIAQEAGTPVNDR